MAIFTVDVIFKYGDRSWTNRWEVSAADIATVVAHGGEFVTFHRGLLLTQYVLDRVRIAPLGTPNAFFETIVEAFGEVDSGTFELLPLFNTVKLLLTSTLGGRAGIKFLRGYLVSGNLTDAGGLTTGTVTAVESAFSTLLANLTTASIDLMIAGTKIVSGGQAPPAVQMRQLHRKRKKTVTPP